MSATKRQAIPIVREQTFAKPTAVADVALDPVDALLVGQTLRSLARSNKTGPNASETLKRVGDQLWSAAQLALAGAR